MNEDKNLISIKILDRIYKIKCPPEQAHELREAAIYVDEQMRKMERSNGLTTMDRLAVITALNVCHEVIRLRKQKNNTIDVMNQRIQELQQKIEQALGSEDKRLIA